MKIIILFFQPDYEALSRECNLARNTRDISDNWSSIAAVIENYGENKFDFASVAGPGFFNDPDMVLFHKMIYIHLVEEIFLCKI